MILPGHDSVYYDLLAFSRPNSPLVWLGYPVSRHLQRRFAVAREAALLCAAA